MIIIGNFKARERHISAYSGLRDTTIPNSVAKYLEKYFPVERVDVSDIEGTETSETGKSWRTKKDMSLSRIIGQRPNEIILVVQCHINIRKDLPCKGYYYIHIDGHACCNPSDIDHGFKTWHSPGNTDYNIAEKTTVLMPWVDLEDWNPHKEKTVHTLYISRISSFKDYKEDLEDSQHTVIYSPHWYSKRVSQALACKTIPIIFTDEPDLYRAEGFEDGVNCVLIGYDGFTWNFNWAYEVRVAEAGYELVKNHHTVEQRLEPLREAIASA